MSYTITSDTFTRADGAPGNEWVDLQAGFPSLAAIASNKLTIPTGAALSSRQRVLVRPLYEAVATQTIRATVTMGNPASQFTSLWVKINTTTAGQWKGFRMFVIGTNVVITKVTLMDTASPASSQKAAGVVGTLSAATDYVFEMTSAGAVYVANVYQSDGTTLLGTCTWTDPDGDATDFTGAHLCGLSTQEVTTIDAWISTNAATSYFTATLRAFSSTVELTKGVDAHNACFDLTRTGGHTASVSISTISGLISNVTNPSNTAPGAATLGIYNLQAAAGAATDTTGTTAIIQMTDGVDNYVLRPTVKVNPNTRLADAAQDQVFGSSTPYSAVIRGGEIALLQAIYGGTNAKTFAAITDGTFNRANPGSAALTHWAITASGSTQDLANSVVNQASRTGSKDLFGQYPCSNNAPTAFAGALATGIDATLTYFLGQGINVILLPIQPRFDSDTIQATSTVNAVSGTTIGVASYTFQAADIGRWLLVEKLTSPTSQYMYRQITAVNAGTDQCTVSRAFTVFPATNGMVCKVVNGTKANLFENTTNGYNWNLAKRATNSGDPAALQNVTYGTKVYYYTAANGVDILQTLEDYLEGTTFIHVDDDTASAPGHVVVAGIYRDVIRQHRLSVAIFTASPDTATIAAGATQQITASAVTGFTTWNWTTAFPGNMLGFTYSVVSGLGSVSAGGLYTAPGGATVATVRTALTNDLANLDDSTITVSGSGGGGGSGTGGAGPSRKLAIPRPRVPGP